jgi:predicted cupin superfamily sugar epimerase
MAQPLSAPLKAHFQPSPSPSTQESEPVNTLITSLSLLPHIEGGFFVETDRDSKTIPSPFSSSHPSTSTTTPHAPQRPGFDPSLRNASTTIFYLLTPNGPQGGFHRNAARTVHTLHHGRGQYVIIHPPPPGSTTQARIETFVVGSDVSRGEKLQWIVEGGKYKASFLLPDAETGTSEKGLLISETVVPGFEFCDHDFLSGEGLEELVGGEKAAELKWLLSPLGKK